MSWQHSGSKRHQRCLAGCHVHPNVERYVSFNVGRPPGPAQWVDLSMFLLPRVELGGLPVLIIWILTCCCIAVAAVALGIFVVNH